MSKKQVVNNETDIVIIYFTYNGEYYAIQKGKKSYYFPKVQIQGSSNDEFRKEIYSKVFSSCKVEEKKVWRQIWSYEIIKVNKNKIKVVEISLDKYLFDNSGLKFVLVDNKSKTLSKECRDIIAGIEQKKHAPIYIGTLILGVVYLILGCISLFVPNLNTIQIDITSFLIMLFSLLITFVYNRILKRLHRKKNGYDNISITFGSLFLAIYVSPLIAKIDTLPPFNTAGLSIIAVGITLLIPAWEYYNDKKKWKI